MVGASSSMREVQVVDYNKKAKTGLLERHLRWLDTRVGKVARIVLLALECIALTLTLIGIPWVFKVIQMSKGIETERLFYERVEKDIQPPGDEPILLKTPKRTFNHINDYAIENDVIWVRRRGEQPNNPWKPLYFDGEGNGDKPVSIDADGANLIVVDDKNFLHYKKVIKEYRPEQLAEEQKVNPHLLGKTIEQGKYLAVDKSTLNNWKEEWFSLPVVHYVVNVFKGKRLKLPEDVRAIAISHRGRFNDYVEDKAGQKCPVSEGVTTLYLLDKDGKRILKYDPWSPVWSKTMIYLPESLENGTVFEALNISASGSTVMAVGYETKDGEKKLKIVTKLADIDTEGGNPGLKYSYFKDESDPEVRVLPFQMEWQEHALPDGEITSQITIMQTGEGNAARELRVQGRNSQGEWGYFSKSIASENWEFHPHEGNNSAPLDKAAEPVKQPESFLHNYSAPIGENGSVIIKNFGERSNYSPVTLTIGDQKYNLFIYCRNTLGNFLGVSSKKKYELVIPKEYHDDPNIIHIFGATKRVFELSVSENKGEFSLGKVGSLPQSFQTV